MKISVAIAISLCTLASVAQAQSPKDEGAIQIVRSGCASRPAGADRALHRVRACRSFVPGDGAGACVRLSCHVPTWRAYAWHSHPLGQILIVTAGTGRVQRWGDPVDEIHQGDVAWIPPGQKHWHGAAPNSSMAHIGIVEQLDGKAVDWKEKVSDAQYGAPTRAQESSTDASAKPRPSQGAIGDFDPKLAELTDDVLYGDIWERPQLSKRDRSLVTVAALIALNRPGQLRSHLIMARKNGVTQEELVETITHLAFYCGWPNAVDAIRVARELFDKK